MGFQDGPMRAYGGLVLACSSARLEGGDGLAASLSVS
jgi:hypothetical protein